MADMKDIEKAYEQAKHRYSEFGVETEKAMEKLSGIAISLHCWQGDDVGGFDKAQETLGGGIMATGAFPGKVCHPWEIIAPEFWIRPPSGCGTA